MITVRSYRWGRWGRRRPNFYRFPRHGHGARDLPLEEKKDREVTVTVQQKPRNQSFIAKAVNLVRGMFRRKV